MIIAQPLKRKVGARSASAVRAREGARDVSSQQTTFIMALTILAVCYNALLAMVHSLVHPVTRAEVMVAEALILLSALVLIVLEPLKGRDYACIGLLFFFVMDALYVSLVNDYPYFDQVRNIAIIAFFGILGSRMDTKSILMTFAIISSLVLFFNILEVSSTKLYAHIFSPASYYESTRGIQEFSLDDSGMFRNALGFDGRFSYNIFHGPRTSSLFVEQVGLANYAGLLSVFMISLWDKIGKLSRLLHISTIILILTSNNTRTSSILAVVMLGGYYIFPYLPKYSNVLIAPIMIGGAALVYYLKPNETGDNLAGRLGLTMQHLYRLDTKDVLGFHAAKSYLNMDSGYPYLILSSTAFGLVILWLFISFFINNINNNRMRSSYALCIYVFLNLLIGATAIFAMKISAPLWLLAGYLAGHKEYLEKLNDK